MGDHAVVDKPSKASGKGGYDRSLPPGVVLDNSGRMCKMDAVGRLYQVDEDGIRITKRGTTRPKGFSHEEWWRKSNTEKEHIRKGLGLTTSPSSSKKKDPEKSYARYAAWT